jgi:hypothetical protein
LWLYEKLNQQKARDKSEPQLVRFSDSSAHQQPLSEKFDADLATPRHVSDPGKHSAKTLFLWIWGGS